MPSWTTLKNSPHVEFYTYREYHNGSYIHIPADNAVSYGDIKPISLKDDPDIVFEELFFLMPYCTGSDYSGALVELSNYQVMLDNYKDHPGVYRVYGGYSTFGILISVHEMLSDESFFDEVLDIITGLNNYPVIDDDDLSNLESEKENEAITDNWLFSTCIDEFKNQHGIIIGDGISIGGGLTDNQKWDLYRELSERANEYPVYEDNGPAYIHWDKIVKAYRTGDLTGLNIPHTLIGDDENE